MSRLFELTDHATAASGHRRWLCLACTKVVEVKQDLFAPGAYAKQPEHICGPGLTERMRAVDAKYSHTTPGDRHERMEVVPESKRPMAILVQPGDIIDWLVTDVVGCIELHLGRELKFVPSAKTCASLISGLTDRATIPAMKEPNAWARLVRRNQGLGIEVQAKMRLRPQPLTMNRDLREAHRLISAPTTAPDGRSWRDTWENRPVFQYEEKPQFVTTPADPSATLQRPMTISGIAPETRDERIARIAALMGGITFRPWQFEVLRRPEHTRVVAAHRLAGKDVLARALAIDAVLDKTTATAFIFVVAERLAEDQSRIAARALGAPTKQDGRTWWVRVPGGGEIYWGEPRDLAEDIAWDPKQDTLIESESAYLDWQRPPAEQVYRRAFLSTPNGVDRPGRRNYFHAAWTSAQWRLKVGVVDTRVIEAHLVKEQRFVLPDAVFRAEYMAEFVDDAPAFDYMVRNLPTPTGLTKEVIDSIAKDGPSVEDILRRDLETVGKRAEEALDRQVVAELSRSDHYLDGDGNLQSKIASDLCPHGVPRSSVRNASVQCVACAGLAPPIDTDFANKLLTGVPEAMTTAADFGNAIISDLSQQFVPTQRKLKVGDRVKIVPTREIKGPQADSGWVHRVVWTVHFVAVPEGHIASGWVVLRQPDHRSGVAEVSVEESDTILCEGPTLAGAFASLEEWRANQVAIDQAQALELANLGVPQRVIDGMLALRKGGHIRIHPESELKLPMVTERYPDGFNRTKLCTTGIKVVFDRNVPTNEVVFVQPGAKR